MAKKLKVGGDNPTLVAGKAFKCPSCGCGKLEEMMTDCVQSTNIAVVDKSGAADYENSSTEGGVIDRIQCLECGHVVADSYEKLVEQAEKWTKGKVTKINFRGLHDTGAKTRTHKA